LFLYSLLPFYYLGGAYAAAIPIVASDALTAPVIYLIVKKVASERLAVTAGLAYALSPIALVDEGYLWLSSQPMTFFIILAIYLLKNDRPVLSTASLAVAILFKTEAIFVSLPYLFVYMRARRGKMWRGLGLSAAIILVAVSPFLILEPMAFIRSTSFPLSLSIGPPEPSRLGAAPFTFTPSSSNPFELCTNTIIPDLYTGAICGTSVNFKEIPLLLLQEKIFSAASLVTPYLFIIFSVGLVAARRSPKILELTSAYSILGFLIIFTRLVHSAYAYYFLPIYALMLASATDRRTLSVGVLGTILSAVLSENPFQTLLPLFLLFAIVVLYDVERTHRTRETSSPERLDKIVIPTR